MNREIKFRGKDLVDNRWVYGGIGEDRNNNVIILPKENWAKGGIVDKNTIGQFTGLHDKNGYEIYEGDIVVINGQIYEVVYNKGMFVIEVKGCGYIPLKNAVCQVRGNIHDNPELLEE